MAMPGVTGLIGGFFGDEGDLYGERPVVPQFPNYSDAVGDVLKGNLANLPRIEDLARRSTDLYRSLLDQATPGATGLMDLGTANIKSMLEGELPKDVEDKVRRYAAEASVGSGTGGSEFAGARTARDLGITSLDLATRGLAASERWLAQAKGNTFDFSRMFLGPEHAIRQAEGQFQRDWLAAQVAASPDPGARGAFDSEMAFLGMVLSAYGGGAGYTGGYRSPYQGGGGGSGAAGYNDMVNRGASFFGQPDSYQGDVNINLDNEGLV